LTLPPALQQVQGCRGGSQDRHRYNAQDKNRPTAAQHKGRAGLDHQADAGE